MFNPDCILSLILNITSCICCCSEKLIPLSILTKCSFIGDNGSEETRNVDTEKIIHWCTMGTDCYFPRQTNGNCPHKISMKPSLYAINITVLIKCIKLRRLILICQCSPKIYFPLKFVFMWSTGWREPGQLICQQHSYNSKITQLFTES